MEMRVNGRTVLPKRIRENVNVKLNLKLVWMWSGVKSSGLGPAQHLMLDGQESSEKQTEAELRTENWELRRETKIMDSRNPEIWCTSVVLIERLHNQPKNPLNKKFSENWKLKIEKIRKTEIHRAFSRLRIRAGQNWKLSTKMWHATRFTLPNSPIPPGPPNTPVTLRPQPPLPATASPLSQANKTSVSPFLYQILYLNARRHRPKNRRLREVFQKWADASTTTDCTFNCKLYSYNYIYNCSWVTSAIFISCRSLSSLPLRHIISLTVLLLMPCASSWHRLTCSAYCTSFVLCKLFTKLTIYPHCQSLYLTLPNHCIPFTLLTHSDKLRTLI